jgi:hypothetical protein
MSGTRSLLLAALAALVACLAASPAHAEPLSDDSGAEWRLEQPSPPEPPPGVEPPGHLVGLGAVGDVEFYSPNRGALITAGNGSTISPGVWLYNGLRWRELSTVCGATDGRIAWAGPDEFWTVSDGRPGQAPNPQGVLPPLEDNTLCRFGLGAGGRFAVLASYGTLGFQTTSYQPIHGAACLSANDCWFAGGPLPAPGTGAFQLHWNGHEVLAEPYTAEGHTVQEMRAFKESINGSARESIYQGLQLLKGDFVQKQTSELPALHAIRGEGTPTAFESLSELRLYGERESRLALDALHLGSDADALWAAAGPSLSAPESEHLEPAAVTVMRYSNTQFARGLGRYVEEEEPSWVQVVGPESEPETGLQAFGEETVVRSIAGEPGGHSAWLAIDALENERHPRPTASGRLARVTADGTVSDRVTLPEAGGGLGPKGAVAHVACPAEHDCWAVTTQGWLFHLSVAGEPVEGPPADNAFAEFPGETPIDQRPLDESLPPTPPDALPEDVSGEHEVESGPSVQDLIKQLPSPFATITLPLLSQVRTRLVHGTTLELSFHLAVKARVRLVAKRHKTVVAATRTQILKAGKHKLLLRLERRRWPTKLDFQTHALAPLPTTNTRESNTGTIGTVERGPSAQTPLGGWSSLP